ncbi:MAG: response regulator [Bacteroidetes bacterium]|jgi:DNA-binding NtrC family response regulator|nr:MAG: response regulator [Bacteroidota bacterium]
MNKSKVLIIDDEMDYCLIMKSYFEGKGYAVTLGHARRDCITLLEEKNPDILLLDNNLPDGKGWELVGPITKTYPDLRLYLISAYHQKTEPFTSYKNVMIWEKPISFSLLDKTFG